jgi:hypothetical protein
LLLPLGSSKTNRSEHTSKQHSGPGSHNSFFKKNLIFVNMKKVRLAYFYNRYNMEIGKQISSSSLTFTSLESRVSCSGIATIG